MDFKGMLVSVGFSMAKIPIPPLMLLYGAQNETYIEGWEKKTSNLLIYKRLCKI